MEFLPLVGVQGVAKTHEFDAVSEDRSIVCSIKTVSWKTSGGKRGSGKVHGAYAELFLESSPGKTGYLVLTDPEFFRYFSKETMGRVVNGVALLHCPLPADLCREIDSIRAKSRTELGFEDPIE